MDPALLLTLRAHNPWLVQPAEQGRLLAASLPWELDELLAELAG